MLVRLPLLLALALISWGSAGLAAEPDFVALAKQADRYQLPKPPNDTKLTLGNAGWVKCLGGSSTDQDPGRYLPGFLIKNNADGSAVILSGFQRLYCEKGIAHRPSTLPFTSSPPQAKLGGYSFRGNHLNTIATAIQCARRGDLETAKALHELWNKTESKDGFFTQESYSYYKNNYPLLLARITFGYYYYRVLDKDADWSHCLKMLEKLRIEYPATFDEKDSPDLVFHKQFIDDLKFTVEAPTPTAGSVESILFQIAEIGYSNGYPKIGTPLYNLYLKGTSIIPELVKLSSSKKITRKVNGGIMKLRETRTRLGQIARTVLSNMCGHNLHPTYSPLSQNWGTRDWEQWLKTSNIENERQFLLQAITQPKNSTRRINTAIPIMILASKHPDALIPIAKKLSKSKRPSNLVKVIMDSPASKVTKATALKTLYQNIQGFDRSYMLTNLAKLDAQAAITETLPLIKKIPQTIDNPDSTYKEALLTYTVAQIDNIELWRTYLAKTKKCSVELRMEIIKPMNSPHISGKNKTSRIAFLAAFLNDSGSRKLGSISKRWDGVHTGFPYHTLSVQNFAALQIASLLDVSGKPSDLWKPAHWQTYRFRVKAALKKETLPKLEG